jgi:hypothetical protein
MKVIFTTLLSKQEFGKFYKRDKRETVISNKGWFCSFGVGHMVKTSNYKKAECHETYHNAPLV